MVGVVSVGGTEGLASGSSVTGGVPRTSDTGSGDGEPLGVDGGVSDAVEDDPSFVSEDDGEGVSVEDEPAETVVGPDTLRLRAAASPAVTVTATAGGRAKGLPAESITAEPSELTSGAIEKLQVPSATGLASPVNSPAVVPATSPEGMHTAVLSVETTGTIGSPVTESFGPVVGSPWSSAN